jgi:hypothetical protein
LLLIILEKSVHSKMSGNPGTEHVRNPPKSVLIELAAATHFST